MRYSDIQKLVDAIVAEFERQAAGDGQWVQRDGYYIGLDGRFDLAELALAIEGAIDGNIR